jgi:hypothetical protein
MFVKVAIIKFLIKKIPGCMTYFVHLEFKDFQNNGFFEKKFTCEKA